MRVAIVTESFLPSTNGVTTSVCRVLDHLRAAGHDAVVLAPRSGPDDPVSYCGFPVHRITSVPVRQFDVGLPHAEVLSVLRRAEPDVVHVASPFVLGARGLSAGRRLGLPLVAVYQTDVPAYLRRHAPGPAGSAASAAAWRWLRTIHSWADLTLAPSTAALADLRAHGVPRTARWGRGVDVGLFDPSWRHDAGTRSLRRALAPGGERLVGFVGRLAPEKELERLVEVAGLAGTRLVLVGDGPSRPRVASLLGEAVRRSGSRGLGPVFLGERHGEDLARAYAALDVFVHPGTHETFGQTIQEAGASGLPVVAPRRGGPVDLVTDGVNGYLFDPDRPGSLRAALGRVLASEEHRSALGERGATRVRGRRWEAVVAELLGHYATVVRTRNGVSTAAAA